MSVEKFTPKNATEKPDYVFEEAKGEFESCFILGYNKAGEMLVMSSTNLTNSDTLWMLEAYKHYILFGGDDE